MDFDPPLKGWFSRDSLCYGVWVRVVAYITAKKKKEDNMFDIR